jgi:hypothetical protein
VLSTDEPIGVFQQLATAAAVAPGRIEAAAGRGSSPITFPIFDLDERDYDMLCSSKLESALWLAVVNPNWPYCSPWPLWLLSFHRPVTVAFSAYWRAQA